MDNQTAGGVTRKERKRQYKKKSFAGRIGRPSKVKRLQETLDKNAAELQQIKSRLSVIKKSKSKALERAKFMER